MPVLVAHQSKIRSAQAQLDPRPPASYSVASCPVEAITIAEARALIEAYEWLGTMNRRPLACYGLRSPDGELLGAVSFGRVGSPQAHDVCGPERRARVIALERGACTHYAPRNAASFLIRHAARLAHRDHGWSVFIAYADPEAGEMGTVYQACGWKYVGQGLGRSQGYREEWRQPGGSTWHSERILRHRKLKKAEALKLGWHHRRRAEKHVYVWFEDAGMVSHYRYTFEPYPKRRRMSRARYRAMHRAQTCLTCAARLHAARSTRKTCSTRCRVRLHRQTKA